MPQAQPYRIPRPRYPQSAKRHADSGSVALEFELNGDGRVVNPRVLLSCPDHALEASALKALDRSSFDMSRYRTGIRYHFRIIFYLEDSLVGQAPGLFLNQCQESAEQRRRPTACFFK
jgi:TonB family protein